METLKNSSDFKKVYSRGKSNASYYLVIYWLPNNQGFNRFGFSISKKIGNAVTRNKLRRRLKEIIRIMEKQKKLKCGFDIIFIARKPVTGLDFHGIKKDVVKLFSKSGIKE
ncbi:MAG: ribonuclease P protein component [Bacillota bacterium]